MEGEDGGVGPPRQHQYQHNGLNSLSLLDPPQRHKRARSKGIHGEAQGNISNWVMIALQPFSPKPHPSHYLALLVFMTVAPNYGGM